MSGRVGVARDATAPTPPWGEPDFAPIVPTTERAAEARMKRHAAVFDIFDQLGLGVVPPQLWNCVDTQSDVARALGEFFARLGIDVGRIIAREPAEIARALELFELLVDVSAAFERLSMPVKVEIARHIFCGDFARVRAVARVVAIFERVRRIAGIWAREGFAFLDRFLDEARVGLSAPLSVSLDEAEAVERTADEILGLIHRYEALGHRYRDVLASLALAWPDAWRTGAEAEHRQTATARFEAVASRVRQLRDLVAVEIAVREMDFFCDVLEALLRRAAEFGEASAPGAQPRSRFFGLREQALAFFDFEPGSTPAVDAVKAAWRQVIKANHPDPGDIHQSEAERAFRQRMAADANRFRDILVRA